MTKTYTSTLIAAALTLAWASASLAQQSPLLVQTPQQAQPVPVGAAQTPTQPPGGFAATLPSVGNEDPATRMNLDNAGAYQSQLVDQAVSRLGALEGVTLSEGAKSDLEVMTEAKRRLMILNLQKEEAAVAVDLWGVLYDNEHVRAWRQQEQQAAADKAKEEAALRDARLDAITQQSAAALQDQSVMYPVVYEVNAGTALLIVPGAGEVYAKAGTVLANGMKVDSVSAAAVFVIDKDGNRVPLAFGTQIINQTQGAAGQTTDPVYAGILR